MGAFDADNAGRRARVKRFLQARADERENMLKIWGVFYSETDGGETYLGVIVAEDDGDAFVKARSLLLPGESTEELRVRLWNDERPKKAASGI